MLRAILLVVAVLAGLSSLEAQGAKSQESLLIGAGDQLQVKVFDTPEMDQQPRVTDAGSIPLMFIGEIKVGGLTPGEASTKIEDALVDKHFMLHPNVQVTIIDYGTQQVSVMGEVKSPGTFDVTAPTAVLSVLAMAGGLNPDADRHIVIQRRNDPNSHIPYFVSNTAQSAFDSSVLVYPGDTVLVPHVGMVYVIGDVSKPGGYEIETNDGKLSAMQAVAIAGYTNKTAMSNSAKLIRKNGAETQEIPLRLSSMEKGKTEDVQLQPGDIVYVPFSWMKNVAVSAAQIAATTSGAAIYVAH